MNHCLILPPLLLAGMLAFASGEEIRNNCFENAVGVSNPSVSPDNHITASSQRGALYLPAYGRLDSTSGGGWCAKEADRNDDWLQVDLGNTFEVCGVGSQGYRNGDDQWVTAFKISYSLYGSRWERYKDGNNEEVEFLRSGRSTNQQRLPVPLVARYIRFHPTKQENWNYLRVEVYGTQTIPDKCYNNPVGVSNPTIIPDNQMKASSQYDEDHQAAYGRLQGKRGDAWCAEEAERNDDWLQVDLGKTFEVCAVSTQGDMHDEHWVTTFKVSYSSNGHSWKTYTKYGKEVEFHRKLGDAEAVDHHGFPSPVFAKYIRFHPTGQHGWNCLKVEVYGTESDGCVTLTDDDPSIDDDVTIDKMKWFETPSIATFASACAGEEALGMESGRITDQQITASSPESKMSGPANARLNLVKKEFAEDEVRIGAWEPDIDDPTPYLKVDFGRNMEIKKIATQGREDYDNWVKAYTLSFGEEGDTAYRPYQEHDKVKVFDGNSDQNGIVSHNLLQPIRARYVLIKPTRARRRVAMRVEFYGCVPSETQKIARSLEVSQTQAKQIEGDASATVSAIKEDNKPKRSDRSDQTKSLKCYRCGRSGHFARDKHCPARSQTCSKCHMKGHFASVCKTNQEQTKKNKRKQDGRGKVNCVEDGEDDDYAFAVGSGDSCYKSGSETVDLQVGGVILSGVLIDSGSSCNIIDQNTWEQLKLKGVKCKSEKTNQKLYPYGTLGPLNTLGKFEASVNFAGKEVTADFIVIGSEGRPIMGRKTAMELDVLRLGPQANGEVERQNRSLLKAMRVAHSEGRDWRKEMQKFLLGYRSTPHTTTGVSPAKLLFGREIRSKLPGVEELRSDGSDSEVLDRDRERKQKGKDYADNLRVACDSNLKEGDKVLLQKPKANKLSPSFETTPFEVVKKQGSHVEIKSSDGVHYKRNVTHLQKYEEDNSHDTTASNPKETVTKVPGASQEKEQRVQTHRYSLRPRRNR
ncbi:hypothetical protein ACROYT_G038461 [Oculina patagonica]